MTEDRRVAVGVGLRPGTGIDEVRALVRSVLEPGWTVVVIATLDRRASEPAIGELADDFGVEIMPYSAQSLTEVPTRSRSDSVAAAVGTASVAEASALLAAGTGSVLTRRASSGAVVVAVVALV